MKGSSILKKIAARAKQLKKKHPGAKYSTLQKQAGREFKSGKLKKRKKVSGSVGAVKPKRRKVVRRKAVRRKKRVVRRVRRVARRRVAKRVVRRVRRRVVRRSVRRTVRRVARRKRGRVSGKGKSIMPLVLLAGGAFLLYTMLNKSSQPPLIITQNPTRNNAAQTAIQIATAAGATAVQIANLIKALNAQSDAQVMTAAATLQTSPDPLTALTTNPQLYGGMVAI